IFEGLKAYRQPDGGIAIFRPYENARRFNRSASRIAMPALPEDVFVEAIETLVSIDHAWVPDGIGRSLYVRPFMIATEPTVAVRPANTYLFAVILSPVDGLFSTTIEPIRAWLSVDYARSAPGGTGDVKFAGNYAGAMIAQQQAAAHGCDQVVWLDSGERSSIEEMGAMNIFFVESSGDGHRLVTPPLTGTQLAGVTRDSIMRLAGSLGYEVAQRPVTVEQWRLGCADGSCTETFACGTAAVITPIGAVRSGAHDWTIGDGTTGAVTRLLRERLLGIQYGTAPDPFGWRHKIG
ncbi:MAG: branched chain amino acid aminotransferase, partial [Pseudonocardiales bacterium]